MSRLHGDDVYNRSVNTQVMRLRRKLETDPANPRYICTERGRRISVRRSGRNDLLTLVRRVEPPVSPDSAASIRVLRRPAAIRSSRFVTWPLIGSPGTRRRQRARTRKRQAEQPFHGELSVRQLHPGLSSSTSLRPETDRSKSVPRFGIRQMGVDDHGACFPGRTVGVDGLRGIGLPAVPVASSGYRIPFSVAVVEVDRKFGSMR